MRPLDPYLASGLIRKIDTECESLEQLKEIVVLLIAGLAPKAEPLPDAESTRRWGA